MGAVMTLQIPLRKEGMPMDMVAVSTKRHSCSVEWKQAGRDSGLIISEEAGGEASGSAREDDSMAARLESTAAILGVDR